MTENLFPRKLTRREMIAAGLLTAAGLSTGIPANAAEDKPVTIGSGKVDLHARPDVGQAARGDDVRPRLRHRRRFARTASTSPRRSASPCVASSSKDGKLQETWSKDFADKVGYDHAARSKATAHGLYWSKEAGRRVPLLHRERRQAERNRRSAPASTRPTSPARCSTPSAT